MRNDKIGAAMTCYECGYSPAEPPYATLRPNAAWHMLCPGCWATEREGRRREARRDQE